MPTAGEHPGKSIRLASAHRAREHELGQRTLAEGGLGRVAEIGGRVQMKLPRRAFLRLASSAAALPAVPRVTWAQTYPTRPITMIVPFAAGGGTDVAARIVGQQMSRTLGQQFVVENVPGAGGTVGSTRMMRSNADGYTIEMGHMGTHAVSVSLYPSLAYKPDIDFQPIGMVVEFPNLIVARKDLPPKDLREFIAYAKANADKLNMAHAGVGSNTFNFGLVLNSLLGVKPTMVPFNGTGPAMNAIVGGQVDYMCKGIAEAGSQIEAGTAKAYAIGAAERHPALPNIPTSKEAGLPEFQASPWFALFAPKSTPRPILDKLTDALDEALDDPNVRKRLVDNGGDIPSKEKRGQQPLSTLVKSEIAHWAPIIKAANVKLD
jgi:tripartite-type tricarboxylate transporter receptor subunit TctC